MPTQEYKVLPAPGKGRKGRGVKGAEARFAHALEALMNEMAAEGWHYLRSDMLPHEERQGLRSSQTTYRSVLVFCREISAEAEPADPPADETLPLAEGPEADYSEPDPEFAPQPEAEDAEDQGETPPERFT
ncbi:hypothetical protein MNBD_ALPHA07-825 [hydrothermal vent metagenome]|uniref:DUF4177 domain-containing protein n=1 Tax=hydrothermal vent metagenome TaxID=652676 RepID=A0A3B0SW50_9ZZZZ